MVTTIIMVEKGGLWGVLLYNICHVLCQQDEVFIEESRVSWIVLTLVDLRSTDNGEYTCVASNIAGSVNKSNTFEVKSKYIYV